MNFKLWPIMAIIFLGLNLFFFQNSSSQASEPPIRSEIGRYTLLHDRSTLLRDLAREKHSSFLDFNIIFSAGLKKLISDVTDATRNDSELSSSANEAQKQAQIYKLMTKNLNTERFLDADLGLAIPLPGINLGRTRLLLNPFFNFGAGTSFSFSNREDALQPKLQLYLRKEQKMGLRALTLFSRHERLTINVYQMKRADSLTMISYADLASKGEIFNLDDIKQDEVTTNTDLLWEQEGTKDLYRVELSELQLARDAKKSKARVLYGNSPFLHLRYQRKDVEETTHFSPFIGAHYRRRYDLQDGLYLGFQMIPTDRLPFHFSFVLDNGFFAVMPQLKTKWFELLYTWRSPHQNPQDEIWVPSMHALEFHFPFP